MIIAEINFSEAEEFGRGMKSWLHLWFVFQKPRRLQGITWCEGCQWCSVPTTLLTPQRESGSLLSLSSWKIDWLERGRFSRGRGDGLGGMYLQCGRRLPSRLEVTTRGLQGCPQSATEVPGERADGVCRGRFLTAWAWLGPAAATGQNALWWRGRCWPAGLETPSLGAWASQGETVHLSADLKRVKEN